MNIAQVIASIATVIALYFVAKSNKHARDAVDRAKEMLSIEQERDERSQASGINSWPAKPLDGGSWGIVISNTSCEPVFNLHIHRDVGRSKSGKQIVRLNTTVKTVPPGSYFVSEADPARSEMIDAQYFEPITGNSDYVAEVEFTDCSGRIWFRSTKGILARSHGQGSTLKHENGLATRKPSR